MSDRSGLFVGRFRGAGVFRQVAFFPAGGSFLAGGGRFDAFFRKRNRCRYSLALQGRRLTGRQQQEEDTDQNNQEQPLSHDISVNDKAKVAAAEVGNI